MNAREVLRTSAPMSDLLSKGEQASRAAPAELADANILKMALLVVGFRSGRIRTIRPTPVTVRTLNFHKWIRDGDHNRSTNAQCYFWVFKEIASRRRFRADHFSALCETILINVTTIG